ncbi:MAG: trypsin-like peptidase domain-containing protein [Coriobacteriia bacterium]|nr:trypsin-like peptidase domain-containing protein [Coriobacteriia bacterium]
MNEPLGTPPRSVSVASTRRRSGGSCLGTLVSGVLGGLLGAGITAAVLWAAWGGSLVAETPPGESAGSADDCECYNIELEGEDLTYAEAVALKAMPSVVSVAIEQTSVNPFTGRSASQVVGNGSGVIIRENGYILTNDHVVAGADGLTVTIGVESVPATVVGRDPSSDLAVLKVERSDLPAMEIGSSADLRVGQPVVAIGSPFGLDQSVTTGIVSALGRTSFMESAEAQLTAYTSLIQTDAAINPGNSGGALTDAAGRLIGINTLIQTGSENVAQSAGVGFAIPVDYAIAIADDLIETGRAEHPYLGIASLTINSRVAELYQLPVDAGALIDVVSAGSPAQAAGIEPGDIVTRIGTTPVASVEDVFLAIRSHRVGDRVEVRIVRGEETLTFDVTLGSDGAQ